MNLTAGASSEIGLDLCESIVFVVAGSGSVSLDSKPVVLGQGDSVEIRRAKSVVVTAVEDLTAVVVIGSAG